jgi:adenine-specific DNA-methyltransferase
MAKTRRKKTDEVKSADYRHTGEKRTNIPPAAIAAEGTVPLVPRVRYHYSPHLPPTLRFDPSGKADQLPELIAEAGRRPLTEKEQQQLADAIKNQRPWLEWTRKHEEQEGGHFDVDPVALHIHERVSTTAMLRALGRQDIQRDLFADPQQPYSEAVQFYRHAVDWANRLILGDSLQVMTSLAKREQLAGKVQTIYLDPPYGIRFSSNFLPQIGQRDVKDRDQDLTREPEMVRAYRDTWTLGTHSYLSYLRHRFVAAKELLSASGSIFVQIGDENLHRVRAVLDEVFGPENICGLITIVKTAGQSTDLIASVCDYVLWYAKDAKQVKFRQTYRPKQDESGDVGHYSWLLDRTGWSRAMRSVEKDNLRLVPADAEFYSPTSLISQGAAKSGFRHFTFQDVTYDCGNGQHWKTNEVGLKRLASAGRIHVAENSIRFIRLLTDFPAIPHNNVWDDTATGNFTEAKLYVVQTNTKIVERCVLMSSDPGDIILDPTCGSGTTAVVAEQWGRRWITCDTSRVSVAVARQRLITSRFPYYGLRAVTGSDMARNPNGAWLMESGDAAKSPRTLNCATIPHITLKSIARNSFIDTIVAKHQSLLFESLERLNRRLADVQPTLRLKLKAKLSDKQRREGKKSITEVDRRRWELPEAKWKEWTVPFDTDPDWPSPLRAALEAYRAAWRTRMDEISACIAANAEAEELVDKPDIVPNIVRVTGPFTVEGVRPEELSIGEDGLFDPTPNKFEADSDEQDGTAARNIQSYLAQMLQHLSADGVTFLGNQKKRFGRLEGLFEDASGSLIHADGRWEGADADGVNTVAISFGPQHGPVTALQVEEVIRSAKRYDEVVIAGFGFDAEAYAVVEAQSHPRLRIHIAQIRPDLNEAMAGLLKDTPNSQLFTVFGQPEVEVKETEEGWVCTLRGVDIYNPVENTVRSSGADKVAAWFLDSDFDGRCFCITQAFFPDQNAWDKIAKALGSSADPEAFAALKGTVSLPFLKGKFGRIAVKVIDPRGNEVMAVRKLG